MKVNKICVIGLGYIGLPTASTFAAHGLEVHGVDINGHIIETLQRGEIHISEPGLAEAVHGALASGKLTAGTNVEEADAFIIAVPTPFQAGAFGEYLGRRFKLADLHAVRSAAQSIVPHLKKGDLVVLESTSPPRTTVDVVAPILERSGLKAGQDFLLCYSPERVLPGQILRELIENARVIGGITTESAQAGHELYATFVKGAIVETDATTAEMVKLMENTFRDANIAIANEFSRLAEKIGVDVWEAITLANMHPRINILDPGPGVGGHCISVDPWFLVETAPELTSLIYHARQVNDEQPEHVVQQIRHALGSVKGKMFAALGLAYKPDVDDLRESPAANVVRSLQKQGAHVRAFEPFKPNAALPGIELAPTLAAVVQNADALLLLVRHSQFAALTPAQVAALSPARVVFDAVNGWPRADWVSAGFQFHRLGDGKS